MKQLSKGRKLVLAAIAITVCALILAIIIFYPAQCCDHTPKSMTAYWAKKIPDIDGNWTEDEWSDTTIYAYTWCKKHQNVIDGTLQLDIAFKHNSTKLFMLARYNDNYANGAVTLDVKFDNLNDGNFIWKDDEHLRFYPAYNAFEKAPVAPFCPGFPQPNPEEPVRCSFVEGREDIIEAALNITRLKPVNNTVGIGIALVIYGDTYCVSVPETFLSQKHIQTC